MRYSQAEKMEVIRLVEQSDGSVSRALLELGIARSTFYEWYKRYQEERATRAWPTAVRSPGRPGTASRMKCGKRWSIKHSNSLRNRRVSWSGTSDQEEYYISETSVYRILKANDLVTSPVYQIVSAVEEFESKTTFVNEMWQTDFPQFKVINWG
jgi:putative transposase